MIREGNPEIYVGVGAPRLSISDQSQVQDMDERMFGMGGSVVPLSESHGVYTLPSFVQHQSKLLPGLRLPTELKQPRKSTFMSSSAQRMLNMLSNAEDRRKAAHDNMEYHVPELEHNFVQKDDFERNFYGTPLRDNGGSRFGRNNPRMTNDKHRFKHSPRNGRPGVVNGFGHGRPSASSSRNRNKRFFDGSANDRRENDVRVAFG